MRIRVSLPKQLVGSLCLSKFLGELTKTCPKGGKLDGNKRKKILYYNVRWGECFLPKDRIIGSTWYSYNRFCDSSLNMLKLEHIYIKCLYSKYCISFSEFCGKGPRFWTFFLWSIKILRKMMRISVRLSTAVMCFRSTTTRYFGMMMMWAMLLVIHSSLNSFMVRSKRWSNERSEGIVIQTVMRSNVFEYYHMRDTCYGHCCKLLHPPFIPREGLILA